MKKLLLIAAMSVMALGAWSQTASDYGIVMEQPAGELKTYDRAGYAYYYSGENIRRGAQTGTIDIVFGDNNNIPPLLKPKMCSWNSPQVLRLKSIPSRPTVTTAPLSSTM